MKCAPIVIPTLNRVEHLSRCIESLKKNPFAKETDLIIGFDYPPSEKYFEGYKEMKKYLRNGIDGFKSVRIIEHNYNLGGIKNANFLISTALSEYDRCIYSEDDNEFAPGFLEYMNEALEKYEKDVNILSVYSYMPRIKNNNSVNNEAFVTNYFSAYGVGLWREKENALREKLNVSYFEELACSKNKIRDLKKRFPEGICYLCSILLRKESVYQTQDGKLEWIDTEKILYAIAENKYLLCSPKPLVKNWGYDGSGEHCAKNENSMISNTILNKEEYAGIIFPDSPTEYEIDYCLKAGRLVPYVSATVRLFLWRIIAKRKMHY